MTSPLGIHTARLRACLNHVQRNGFQDADIGGDPLDDQEYERLDMALFFFQERWRDDPIARQVTEHGSDSNQVHFIFVDFITRDAIRPYQRLSRYSFASRALYLARSQLSRGTTSHFFTGEATIDADTRELLARARITMRLRTMQYVVNGARRSRLLLAPTNVMMGYVV